MRTVRDVLRDADPLRHEPDVLEAERARLRRAVVSGATEGSTPSSSPFWFSPAAVIAAVILTSAIVALQFWPAGAPLQAAVRFEVRLAEERPGSGLRQARIAGSERVIYLHPEVIATNGDIVESAVVDGDRPSRFQVAVEFSKAGAERMRRATAAHVGRPLAILIDGAVIAAPVVRGPIGGSALITGDYSRAEAERIEKGIRLP